MSIDNTQELETKTPQSNIQPGELLRQKREALGLTQKDIAERLRLKVKVIDDLETNHLDDKQVATFIRGYFRSYAKVVGIKDKDILAALDQSGRGQEKVQTQAMHSFSQKTKRQKHDSRVMKLTWGILVVILGISSVWWWQNHQLDTLTPATTTSETAQAADDEQGADQQATDDSNFQAMDESATAEDTAGTEIDMTLESDQVTTDEGQDALQPADPNENATDQAVTDNTNTTATAETAQPAQAAEANSLVMAFSDDCWIQIKDSTGAILSTGLKKSGESLTLSGKLPYSIILGAPHGVSATFAGEPVDLSKFKAGKVARFTLPL
ncbi:MAG: cytoskeleton protein RodZ [Vibrio sp.]